MAGKVGARGGRRRCRCGVVWRRPGGQRSSAAAQHEQAHACMLHMLARAVAHSMRLGSSCLHMPDEHTPRRYSRCAWCPHEAQACSMCAACVQHVQQAPLPPAPHQALAYGRALPLPRCPRPQRLHLLGSKLALERLHIPGAVVLWGGGGVVGGYIRASHTVRMCVAGSVMWGAAVTWAWSGDRG
jgi:hypothetical protein